MYSVYVLYCTVFMCCTVQCLYAVLYSVYVLYWIVFMCCTVQCLCACTVFMCVYSV